MALEAVRESRGSDGPWRGNLNQAQLLAATHSGGPLLIVAGAGTGKTGTLACRVAHLLETGVAPHQILLLTFSRRAAREMLSRAQRISGDPRAARVWGGTFHAVANRLLRIHGRAVGLLADFTVLDQADTADLLDLIRDDLGIDTRARRFPRKDTLAAIYSRMVNAQRPLAEVLEQSYPWCIEERSAIASIFDAYTHKKRETNVLDYDDLLLHWMVLASLDPAGERMASQFSHILVDEYQDTNAIQAQLLSLMHRHVREITVVGDDAQAIYSFRAATVENILGFAESFEDTRVVLLEQNYRSTMPLLHATNAVIAQAERRHHKTLWSERAGERRPVVITCLDESDQASAVCEAILQDRERGVALMQQAVLYRTSHHADLLEVEMSRRNIPYIKYGGLRFLEAAHVKDVVAFMRLLENPRDAVSWFRVLQMIDGIGPAAARRILRQIGVEGSAAGAAVDPLRQLATAPPEVSPVARPGFDALCQLVALCAAPQAPPLASQMERFRSFCEPLFERRYSRVDSRLRDLEQLEALAAQMRSNRRCQSRHRRRRCRWIRCWAASGVSPASPPHPHPRPGRGRGRCESASRARGHSSSAAAGWQRAPRSRTGSRVRCGRRGGPPPPLAWSRRR